MKIAVHSDLHYEGYKLPRGFLEDQDFDVLVLAGDIVSSRTVSRLADFRKLVLDDKPIIFVPGNHEYYNGCMIKTKERMKTVCEENDIVLLDEDSIIIGDVEFIGATGWTDLESYPHIDIQEKRDSIQFGIMDFRVVDNNSLDKMVERSKSAKQFIDNALYVNPSLKRVVITHFAPTEEHNNEYYSVSGLSSYFVNNWIDLIYEHEPDVWIFGHTHYNNPSKVYHTNVICNQKGYGIECGATYDPNYIIEV